MTLKELSHVMNDKHTWKMLAGYGTAWVIGIAIASALVGGLYYTNLENPETNFYGYWFGSFKLIFMWATGIVGGIICAVMAAAYGDANDSQMKQNLYQYRKQLEDKSNDDSER